MGSSRTDYRGAGFWTKDGVIQYWLFAVAREIPDDPSLPEWLRDVRTSWLRESTTPRVGCVDAEVDRLLRDDRQVQELIPYLRRALDRVARFGDHVPKEELNGNNIGGYPNDWVDGDMPVSSVLKAGEAFIDLLQGTLRTPPNGYLEVS